MISVQGENYEHVFAKNESCRVNYLDLSNPTKFKKLVLHVLGCKLRSLTMQRKAVTQLQRKK